MKRIGEILTRNKTPVVVEDNKSYRQVTIRTNYKGVVLRGSLDGFDIGTKNQFAVSAGQFILSRIDARNGAFGIVPRGLDGAIVTNDFLAFDIVEDEVDLDFFNVFLQSPIFLEACVRASRGNTNRKRVNEEFFLNYQVDLPPLSQQRNLIKRINTGRTNLAAAQCEIAHQQSLVAKLGQALLQEAIEGKLTGDWRRTHRETESVGELLRRIQDKKDRLIAAKKFRPEKRGAKVSEGETPFPVPASWQWCRVADIGVVIGGLTKNASRRDGHRRLLPYLGVANVYADRLDLTNLKEIGVADSEVEKLLLEKDDLLVVEGNGSRDQVGRVARWDGSVDPCVHQNHVIKVRPGEPMIAPWVLCWFLSPGGRALIEEQARTSTGLFNLSTGKVARLPVPMPPLAEQSAILDRLQLLKAKCGALERETECSRIRAARLLQAILNEAFASD